MKVVRTFIPCQINMPCSPTTQNVEKRVIPNTFEKQCQT